MTNEMSNVPELRFPEFDGEWEEGTIKSLVHGNLSDGDWINKEYLLPNGKYRIIQTGNISVGKYLNKEKSSKFISQSSYDELKANEVFPGDILISRLADPAGRSIIMPNINWKMVTSVDVAIIRPNKKFESYFLISILNTDKKLYDISKLVSGTSHKRISRKNLEKVKIIYPKIQEQQKIGNFFSKLDRQIELEEQKLEKLKEQKKGYMQKIFSQELRFKDESGKDYPEWEIKKLGELYKIVMGQSPKSINYTDDNSYPVLVQGNADIYNGNIFPRIYTKEITKLVKKGDILLTVRAPVGEIGIAQFEACMGRGVCSIEGDKFIYYFLEMFGIQNKWQKLSQGSTFESISGNEVRNIEMPIPSPREREKVSDFFSELDHIINMHSQKIDNMKLRKQGLLQKMFV